MSTTINRMTNNHVALLLQRRLQQHVRSGPQVRGDTGHRPVHGLPASGRHVRIVLLHGISDPVAQTRRRRGPGGTVAAAARPTAQPLPTVAPDERAAAAAAAIEPGETHHAAVRGTAEEQDGGRGDAVQGQAPAGRGVRRFRRGQPAVHAVRRRVPVVVVRHAVRRRVRRAHDVGRRPSPAGHGPPGQVVGRAVQQTQAAARVLVRVQPGHLRARHRRPVRPAQEHGRHSAHLQQGAVVRISGGGEDAAGVARQAVVVAHGTGPDVRAVAAGVHVVVRGHGAGGVGHGQLHAVLLPDVPARPAVLPERRSAGGRRVPGARVPRFPVPAVAVAAQPELRDRLHTGGAVQRAGDVRAVADVPEHRAGPRAQRHRRRRRVRHIRPVRHARVSGRQHVLLLPIPAARQPGRARRRRVRRVNAACRKTRSTTVRSVVLI